MSEPARDIPARDLQVGDLIEVEVGRVVHGGHCLAHAGGRTLLVRHALPGERLVVQITGVASKVSRADAVQILRPSPMRVEPPCALARPGGCGGCDFQHVDPAGQRILKSQVIADAFRRHARMDGISVEVEELSPVLHWRTRMRWHAGAGGQLGLHAHRSAEVLEVSQCAIAAAELAVPPTLGSPADVVRTAVGTDGQVAVLADHEAITGSRRSLQQVRERTWRVDADTFWQAHPLAPSALVDAVLSMGRPAPGQRWWDLFAGAGLFSAFLAEEVGPSGTVIAVEGHAQAIRDARRGLHDLPQARLVHAEVGGWLGQAEGSPEGPVDGVVLDPPRTGLGAAGMALLTAARPGVIVYVACDPTALARDVAAAAAAGYRLTGLRAFDAFPMTHHVEVVATLASHEGAHEIS